MPPLRNRVFVFFRSEIQRAQSKKEAALFTSKRQPVAPIKPHKEWMEKEASEKEGLAAAAGALADFDAEIDEMIEAVYAVRATAKG